MSCKQAELTSYSHARLCNHKYTTKGGSVQGLPPLNTLHFTTFSDIFMICMFQWKCKSQLRISGISFHVYWGSVFFTSLVVYLVPATICLIIVLAMQVGVLCNFMHLHEKIYLYM